MLQLYMPSCANPHSALSKRALDTLNYKGKKGYIKIPLSICWRIKTACSLHPERCPGTQLRAEQKEEETINLCCKAQLQQIVAHACYISITSDGRSASADTKHRSNFIALHS